MFYLFWIILFPVRLAISIVVDVLNQIFCEVGCMGIVSCFRRFFYFMLWHSVLTSYYIKGQESLLLSDDILYSDYALWYCREYR